MKDNIKKYVNKFPFVSNRLRIIYKFLRRTYPKLVYPPIKEQIEKTFKDKEEIFFIQVGSNDGFSGDPINDLIIRNKTWSGIFIEPVNFLFKRLVQNYQDTERFVFENVAIGAEKEVKKFYYVEEEANLKLQGKLGPLYDQLGSFDKQHILKHIVHVDIEPYIIEEEIQCVPLIEILQKHNVKKIDLLHIDTEGYDYKILEQIDFTQYKPTVILFEHAHLSKIEKKKAKSSLRSEGYKLTVREMDTTAILTS